MNSNFNGPSEKVMTPDQFTQVVDAILEGKYSWACVLILRFAGYNPLHYIPYRTYNRLMKDNSQQSRIRIGSCAIEHFPGPDSAYSNNPAGIRDLNYLEPLEQQVEVRGGKGALFANFSSVLAALKAWPS